MVERLIRRQEVEEMTALSRSTIYRHKKEGRFPEPVRIGPRAVRWRYSDIIAHIESKSQESDNGKGK